MKIKIKMDASGMNDALNNLIDALPDQITGALRQAGAQTAGYARTEAPTSKHGESGGSSVSLKNSITSETFNFGDAFATRIKCAAPHAQYVEFGTGIPVGHSGPWIYPIIIDGQKTFRRTYGMAPRPFMTPAIKYAKRAFAASLRAALKGGVTK